MLPARTADNSTVLVVPNVNVRMETQHSVPPVSLHDLLPETVTDRMVVVSRINLHDLIKLNVTVVCDIFHRMRKLCQTYDNFGEETISVWLIQ